MSNNVRERKRPLRETRSLLACRRRRYPCRRTCQRSIWLALLFFPMIAPSESVPHDLPRKKQRENEDQNDGVPWSQLLPVLQDALSEASFHSDTVLESPGPKRNSLQQWKRRWNKFQSACRKVTSSCGVASVADSPLLAATAMAAASVEQQLKDSSGQQNAITSEGDPDKVSSVATKDEKKEKRSRKNREASNHSELDIEVVEGARLIAASFGLLANTFGLLADSVRVMGDTAAGVTGSSVKMFGTAVKTVSSGLDTASRILAPNETSTGGERKPQRKPLTSERMMDRKRGVQTEYDHQKIGLVGSTRHVAARSVR